MSLEVAGDGFPCTSQNRMTGSDRRRKGEENTQRVAVHVGVDTQENFTEKDLLRADNERQEVDRMGHTFGQKLSYA